LFLDEIGELPLDMQSGLLRVLETGTYRRIGSDRERSSNCRVVAATNRPLLERVEQGTFRPDLYYRLSVAKATIPPLRVRREDVSLLIEHMLETFCAKHGFPKKAFTPEAMQVLLEYDWPGNGRQLRNVVETTLVCSGDPIALEDLPIELLKAQTDAQPQLATETRVNCESTGAVALGSDLSIRQHERRLILSALKKYKKISLVARSLGISRSTLYRRLDEFGIDPRADSTS
jgi:DNA-binding NtrC family response regulator